MSVTASNDKQILTVWAADTIQNLKAIVSICLGRVSGLFVAGAIATR